MQHYDEKYFVKQKKRGELAAAVNLFLFSPFIHNSDVVLDFGCGGGYLLNQLKPLCKEVYGVEINPAARVEAKRLGIDTFENVEELSDASLDIVISNHALEHITNPYGVLVNIREKMKKSGEIICVVPHQSCGEPFVKGDRNQHLYTWNPMTLGNLFSVAGFDIEKVDVIRHKWIPNYTFWYGQLGEKRFRFLSKVWAYFNSQLSSTRYS